MSSPINSVDSSKQKFDPVVYGAIVSGKPHPLLAPEKSESWGEIRKAFDALRDKIKEEKPDLLMIYSAQWFSVIGHQIQADPNPKWNHVDSEWHELGTMKYEFNIDSEFADLYQKTATERGLHSRTVAYEGFPIDTGSVVALKLLNPDNKIPACIVSCNMYSDRTETIVLGKAGRDAAERSGKKVMPIAVTSLSNRIFPEWIDPNEDRIYSKKDDEWNRKILEFLEEGRLEDVSQLARQFAHEAHGEQKMKALWWLAAFMGQHNRYDGEVFGYGPIWGSGAAVVGLKPSLNSKGDREFDEADVDVFTKGDDVLGGSSDNPGESTLASSPAMSSSTESVETSSVSEGADSAPLGASDGAVVANSAPKPVGAYPHARKIGNLLYLSGVGPRTPGTDEVPGGACWDKERNPQKYSIEMQTQAVIENIKHVLRESGSSLDKVRDITCFLTNMKEDFEGFNKVYNKTFASIGPTRTTLEVGSLPTPIAVEFKVIAEC